MGADGATTCDLFITLVHGTWPRGALRDVFLTPFYGTWPSDSRSESLWFAEGSEFRKRLGAALGKRQLSAHISAFLWSGQNSVAERDKAARKLAEHIRTKKSSHPSSNHLLVAHSHGGNVALRALNHLGSAHDEIFVATIATPFVEILPASLSLEESMWPEVGLIIVAYILIIPPLMFFDDLFMNFLGLSGVTEQIVRFLMGLAVAVPFIVWLRKWRTKNTAKVDELVELTSLSPCVRKHPIPVLRAVDDEASLSLGAAAIGNRLSLVLEKWSYRIFLPSMFLLGVALAVISIATVFQIEAPLLTYWNQFEDSRWMRWVMLPLSAILLMSPILALGPGAFKSSYGRELLLNSRRCEINSQSAPDSIERLSELQSASEHTPSSWGTVVTLHQTAEVRKGLRHGLYGDPQCADRIAGWLRSEFGRRGK
jgi:hypothetical protein